MRKHIPSLVFNIVVPFVAYLLIKPYVDTETTALAIATAFPALFTIGTFIWKKRLDPIGAVALAGYIIALAIVLLSNGNPFFLKVNDVFVTGPVGVAFLISVAIGRPLHLVIHEFISRRKGTEVGPRTRRGSATVSLLIGAMLTIHAVVMIFLAVSLSTASFLAISRPVGLSIIGAGVAAILVYRRHLTKVSLPATRW
jgi:hypothetical protein